MATNTSCEAVTSIELVWTVCLRSSCGALSTLNCQLLDRVLTSSVTACGKVAVCLGRLQRPRGEYHVFEVEQCDVKEWDKTILRRAINFLVPQKIKQRSFGRDPAPPPKPHSPLWGGLRNVLCPEMWCAPKCVGFPSS